jgi:hypothetical protein
LDLGKEVLSAGRSIELQFDSVKFCLFALAYYKGAYLEIFLFVVEDSHGTLALKDIASEDGVFGSGQSYQKIDDAVFFVVLEDHLDTFHKIPIVFFELLGWAGEQHLDLVFVVVLALALRPIDLHILPIFELSTVAFVVFLTVFDWRDVGLAEVEDRSEAFVGF